MFYYISKKYPKFVRHLLKTITDNRRKLLTEAKRKHEVKAKENNIFSDPKGNFLNFFPGGESEVEDEDVGRIDRIMSHLVDTGITHVLEKQRIKSHRKSSTALPPANRTGVGRGNVSESEDIEGLVSNFIDGIGGPNTSSNGERRRKKIHKEFEMLKNLFHPNTSNNESKINETYEGGTRFLSNTSDTEKFMTNMTSNIKDPYSTFVNDETSQSDTNQTMSGEESGPFVTNRSDPYAAIAVHAAKNPPKESEIDPSLADGEGFNCFNSNYL